MRILWEATDLYEDSGGVDALQAALRSALAQTPREHLQRLDGIYVYDYDPKGARLGVYLRDHRGIRIELFLQAHVGVVQNVVEHLRFHALVLQLAHTLFHEVGHHVTLTLNPRTKPSRKRDAVTDTLEKWAEAYVEKRMAKFQWPPPSAE